MDRMPEERKKKQAVLRRSPTDKPPFTLAQLRKAVAPHCFQRSLIRSVYYLVHDLAIAGCLLYLALVGIPALPTALQYLTAWPPYWAAQRLRALRRVGDRARVRALNDVLGLLLHSSLLAPYFSWKYSHLRHHSNTGSLDHDEVFVPRLKSALPRTARTCTGATTPAPGGCFLLEQLTVGWGRCTWRSTPGAARTRASPPTSTPTRPSTTTGSAPRSSSPTPASWPRRSRCTGSRRRSL